MIKGKDKAIKKGLMISGLAFILAGCSEPEQVVHKEVIQPVKLMTIAEQQYKELRRFPARVYANQESQISFRISGALVKLPVAPAQEVKKGELLAKLDDRDIKNEVDLRQADFDLANLNYQRINTLREKKVVSQSELDSARANLKATRASLRLAQDKLQYATLRAPFDGRIATTSVENHQFVQAKETILTLQDSQTLDVKFQLPETILNRLTNTTDVEVPVSVVFDGAPERSYSATYKEHATNVTSGTQSYEVTLTLPAPEEIIIYPGMGSRVEIDFSPLISSSNRKTDIVIPLTAVLTNDSSGTKQAWVFSKESGTVTPVNVATSHISQSGIHISAGLNDGDQVVVTGLSQLTAGQKVKPLVRERGL